MTEPVSAPDVRMVYVTYPTLEGAQRTAKRVLEQHMAACVNVFMAMQTMYWWEGKLEVSNEAVALYKTTESRLDALEAEIRASHPYKCPCIINWPLSGGNADYIEWVRAESAPR